MRVYIMQGSLVVYYKKIGYFLSLGNIQDNVNCNCPKLEKENSTIRVSQ